MKYVVTLEIISKRTKEINVYARDESEAQYRAIDIVLAWDGVDDVTPIDVVEVDP